jgi:hypothetical protein
MKQLALITPVASLALAVLPALTHAQTTTTTTTTPTTTGHREHHFFMRGGLNNLGLGRSLLQPYQRLACPSYAPVLLSNGQCVSVSNADTGLNQGLINNGMTTLSREQVVEDNFPNSVWR